MKTDVQTPGRREISSVRAALPWMVGAVGAFHLAFHLSPVWWLVLGYLGCLFELRRLATARHAFYLGLVVGLGVFVPATTFLWTIFSAAAIPLWCILALFHAVFLLALQQVETRWGGRWAVVLAPILWCGIEYFRSEVWWLRFSWLTAGSLLGADQAHWLRTLGVYGAGAVFMAFVAVGLGWPMTGKHPQLRRGGVLLLTVFCVGLLPRLPAGPSPRGGERVTVGGVQLEFPGVPEVVAALDALIRERPQVQLIVLSEYTFDGPIPANVRQWCRKHGKWLVAGGKQPIDSASPADDKGRPRQLSLGSGGAAESYYNTAFVVSTNGEVVFSQAKSRPIQFFKDGEPAPEQRLWDSPWGRLGIAICYDVSYRQVMDRLVRMGAQALIVPTMDVEQWGDAEHRLNARMAVLRAAEYQLPLFRVASSGISQLVGPEGRTQATAAFPGAGDRIFGELQPVPSGGRIPLDAGLAPGCLYLSGAALAALGWSSRRSWRSSAGRAVTDAKPPNAEEHD